MLFRSPSASLCLPSPFPPLLLPAPAIHHKQAQSECGPSHAYEYSEDEPHCSHYCTAFLALASAHMCSMTWSCHLVSMMPFLSDSSQYTTFNVLLYGPTPLDVMTSLFRFPLYSLVIMAYLSLHLSAIRISISLIFSLSASISARSK